MSALRCLGSNASPESRKTRLMRLQDAFFGQGSELGNGLPTKTACQPDCLYSSNERNMRRLFNATFTFGSTSLSPTIFASRLEAIALGGRFPISPGDVATTPGASLASVRCPPQTHEAGRPGRRPTEPTTRTDGVPLLVGVLAPLVAMPGAPSSLLFLVVRPGAPSSVRSLPAGEGREVSS